MPLKPLAPDVRASYTARLSAFTTFLCKVGDRQILHALDLALLQCVEVTLARLPPQVPLEVMAEDADVAHWIGGVQKMLVDFAAFQEADVLPAQEP